MLEIKPLIYFVAAFEEKNISRAAVRCFIAQPSISHAIKSLENKLKYPLFNRSKKGLTATSHGVRFYKEAKQLIEHMQ
ncbi:MAG: DNA-binding transcriptional LysR family regulator, partial [Paraglaciecola sp.]